MYEIEIVTVAADEQDGKPTRFFDKAETMFAAEESARNTIQYYSASNARIVGVSHGPGFSHIAFLDTTGIVGYANIKHKHI